MLRASLIWATWEPDFYRSAQQSTLVIRAPAGLVRHMVTVSKRAWSQESPQAPVKCFLERDSFGTHASCVTLGRLLNLSLLQGGGGEEQKGRALDNIECCSQRLVMQAPLPASSPPCDTWTHPSAEAHCHQRCSASVPPV